MMPKLARDRRRGRRPLGPDLVLDRDVIDDRQHRVDDVAGTAEHRQKAGRERREDRHEFRIAPQNLLGKLQQHVEAARGLGLVAEAATTATIVSMTSTGGGSLNANTRTTTPMPPSKRHAALRPTAGEDKDDLQEEFHDYPFSAKHLGSMIPRGDVESVASGAARSRTRCSHSSLARVSTTGPIANR